MKSSYPKKLILLSLFVPALELSASAADLIVHEWGTFTSVQNSKGELLEGLYHEDEPLPPFVYGREQFSKKKNDSKSLLACNRPNCKRMEPTAPGTLVAVNEKLETPVIYFYSKDPNLLKASVNVQFPNGIISQWFPDARSYSPPVDQISTIAQGKMSWTVDILPSTQEGVFPKIEKDSIWAPSREVKANSIRVGSEEEKFIFYRGLGRFDTLAKTRSSQDTITFINSSENEIKAAFLLDFDGVQGSVIPLGSIGPRQNRETAIKNLKAVRLEGSAYLSKVTGLLEEALVNSGLYRDEASAMVRTWEKSYFKTKGTRILYVLPRSWTDQILPIQIQPTPKELVRTLVGRIEVLTLAEEQEIRSKLNELGRFAEPKMKAVLSTLQ